MSYIPGSAINSLEKRFALGVQNYKEKAWNCWSPNQNILDDDDWVIDRLRHAIAHAELVIRKITDPSLEDGDDDAGAIMWAGAMLAARNSRKHKAQGAATTVQDASLHAAARDLLRELKSFEHEASSWHEMHHHNATTLCDSLCARLAPAREAIAKAEGAATPVQREIENTEAK